MLRSHFEERRHTDARPGEDFLLPQQSWPHLRGFVHRNALFIFAGRLAAFHGLLAEPAFRSAEFFPPRFQPYPHRPKSYHSASSNRIFHDDLFGCATIILPTEQVRHRHGHRSNNIPYTFQPDTRHSFGPPGEIRTLVHGCQSRSQSEPSPGTAQSDCRLISGAKSLLRPSRQGSNYHVARAFAR